MDCIGAEVTPVVTCFTIHGENIETADIITGTMGIITVNDEQPFRYYGVIIISISGAINNACLTHRNETKGA